MKKTLIALLATAGVVAGASAAFAADATRSQTSNLTVRATLTNGCNINFNNGDSVVDFGPVVKLDADKSEQKSFKIECTNSLKNADGSEDTTTYAPQYVSLDKGSVADSTIADRKLGNVSDSKNGDTLDFQVFKGNSGSKNVWGDQVGEGLANSVYYTKDQNATYPFQVVLLAQDIKGKQAGTYQNTMVATVSYTANAK